MTHLDAGKVKCTAATKTHSSPANGPEIITTCGAELTVLDSVCEDGYDSDTFMEALNEVPTNGTDPKTDQAPMLLRKPQDTTALVGDRVLLKATYLGHPEPTIRWTKAVRLFKDK